MYVSMYFLHLVLTFTPHYIIMGKGLLLTGVIISDAVQQFILLHTQTSIQHVNFTGQTDLNALMATLISTVEDTHTVEVIQVCINDVYTS